MINLFEKIEELQLKICDTFACERQLLEMLGFPKTKSANVFKAQGKVVRQYVNIEPVESVNKRYKKSRGVQLTDIYDTMQPKKDNRTTLENQDLVTLIKTQIANMGSCQISYKNLIDENIIPMLIANTYRENYYSTYLFNFLQGKVNSALRQLAKESGGKFNWEYVYRAYHEPTREWVDVSYHTQIAIEELKTSEKIKIVALHNFTYHENKTWKDIAFQYRKQMYNAVTEAVQKTQGYSKLFKVLSLTNELTHYESVPLSTNPIETIETKMKNYITKRSNYVDDNVINYHKKLFSNDNLKQIKKER